jgi:uncharacterized phiE125 gp8 family phage protein
MALTVTTPPSTLLGPVTLAEAKAQSRIVHAAEDSLIEGYLTAATAYVERITGRRLLTTGLTLKLDRFPEGHAPIKLPGGKIQSVTSIVYQDSATTTATLSNTKYETVLDREPGEIWMLPAETWPSTYGKAQDVTIIYQAGYGDAAAVPQELKLAIQLLVNDWMAYRGDQSVVNVTKIPRGVEALLANFIAWGANWGV